MTTGEHRVITDPALSNEGYDRLKNVITLVLPALATFYILIADQWGLPFSDKVAATITGLATLLGLILRALSKSYASIQADKAKQQEDEAARKAEEVDGELSMVTIDDQPMDLLLHLDSEAMDRMVDKDRVVFKVNVRKTTT